ncbi:MAG: hypothetical protein ACFFCZ_17780 [Promethearchaeota archaeon]
MRADVNEVLKEVKTSLQVSEHTATIAAQILHKLDKKGLLRRKKLISCVGAAFYTACKLTGEIRSQSIIAGRLNISENTIRNHSRKHSKILSLIALRET